MTSSQSEDDAEVKCKHQQDATIFAASLMDQVNAEDISSMVHIQREMLSRFEKTNEMLINFNILSSGRYEATLKDFQKHTQLLYEMKKDLDGVFKRIRVMKQRLEKSHPEAFAACSSIYNVVSDKDDDSDDDTVATQSTQVADESSSQTDVQASAQSHELPVVTVSGAGSESTQEQKK